MPSFAYGQDEIETLTRINIQDMLDNFGLGYLRRGRGLFERIFRTPARKFAIQVAQFDERAGQLGLQAAAAELLAQYVDRLDVIGGEHIPATGGALFVSNHPGMTDTLACFTSISRADLRIVSADRPFLRALPNISKHLFFIPDQAAGRLAVVRQVARYLQAGGAVLINPAGQIEPDPLVMRGAVESLRSWSDSLGLFVRLASQSVVVPTVVSGVIHGGSLRSPLTYLRHAQKERERIAATWQVFLHGRGTIRREMRPRIEFGAPLKAFDLIPLGDTAAITRAITDAVAPLVFHCAMRDA